MKALGKHIKLYKGVILERIHSKLTADQNLMSIEEVDAFLKDYAGIDKSCKDMTKEELNDLIEYSKQFATTIGLDIDDNEKEIQLNWK